MEIIFKQKSCYQIKIIVLILADRFVWRSRNQRLFVHELSTTQSGLRKIVEWIFLENAVLLQTVSISDFHKRGKKKQGSSFNDIKNDFLFINVLAFRLRTQNRNTQSCDSARPDGKERQMKSLCDSAD